MRLDIRMMRSRIAVFIATLCCAPGVLATGSTLDRIGFGSGGTLGPSMTDRRTTSMEPIDICLYDERAHRVSARFRIPAGYVEREFRDKYGHLAAVWLVFWLPDYRPESLITELQSPDPAQRRSFMEEKGRDRVWIELSGQVLPANYFDPHYQGLRNSNRQILPDEDGLEHYRDQLCEAMSSLKKQGRDISTRHCNDGYNIDYFIGESASDLERVSIACGRHSSDCSMSSRYQGYYAQIHFPRSALAHWREYDHHSRIFLKKYLMAGQAGKSKSGR